jgi:16S rRNA processing protein RimM
MAESPSNSKNEINNGSPEIGEPLFLIIGKIRKPHGVRGEMLVKLLTEFPERIEEGKRVYIGESKTEHTIATVRFLHEGCLIKFSAVNSPEQAKQFCNEMIYVRAVNLPKLPENQYYYHDLLGMQVKTDEGEMLGTVHEILETGANDVLVVRKGEQEHLFPFIKQVVLDVNQRENYILIKKLEWK